VIHIAIKVQFGYAKFLADIWYSNGARHILSFTVLQCILIH